MKTILVTTAQDIAAFHALPHQIYAEYPLWVAPIEAEVEAVFSPTKNAFFQYGEAQRWLLEDNGRIIGRIAAFYHTKKAQAYAFPTGGCGFFECVNDFNAAAMLFDVAQQWLAEKGMEAMDGPINFGENDRHWGLLVAGFEQLPYWGMPYQPPYYEALFRQYGFETYFKQHSFELDLRGEAPQRLQTIAQWALAKNGVEIRYPQPHNLAEYAQHLQTIYNEAWQHHEHFTPITHAQLETLVRDFKHILIDALMPFAFVKGEPAAFVVSVPDLNQLFQPLKGKFPLWQQLLFLWRSRNRFAAYRHSGQLTRARALVAGVRPSFQRYGMEAAMVCDAFYKVKPLGITTIDVSWIGDFNPKMLSFAEALCGGEPKRTHLTLRYIFDRTRPFERAAMIS